MATTAAAVVARARREIQHHFFSNDAVRPDRAVPFEPHNGVERRQFERMVNRGIIHEAQGSKYWLDVARYDDEQRARHRRVKIALLAVIGFLIILLLVGVVRL